MIEMYMQDWYDAVAYTYVKAVEQKRWRIVKQLKKLMLGIDVAFAGLGEE